MCQVEDLLVHVRGPEERPKVPGVEIALKEAKQRPNKHKGQEGQGEEHYEAEVRHDVQPRLKVPKEILD